MISLVAVASPILMVRMIFLLEGEFGGEDLAAVLQDDGLATGRTGGGEQKAANRKNRRTCA
jgi:hypothetical protein